MKTILVVEDDPTMCWLLRNLLHSKYAVTTRSNGMEAILWLSAKNIPDLIISDIKMPLMDGFELLENLAINDLYKNIPVMMLSGYDDSSTLKRCYDLGAYCCLAKPFKPSELLEKVAEMLTKDLELR
jgi:CheY-like chemotaxis protein